MLSHVLVRTREVLHTTILFELQRHAHYCNSTATQLHAIVFCIEAKRWPRFSLVLTHYCDCRGSCGVRFIFLFFFFYFAFLQTLHIFRTQIWAAITSLSWCNWNLSFRSFKLNRECEIWNVFKNVKFGTFARCFEWFCKCLKYWMQLYWLKCIHIDRVYMQRISNFIGFCLSS